MSNPEKHCCAKCGYPAKNSTTFYDQEKHSESLLCPDCGSDNIISDRRYKFRMGWELIHNSGVSEDIDRLDDITLRLAEPTDSFEKSTISEDEIPADVREEIREKQTQANEILRNSGILDQLKKIGVDVRTNITVFRSN